MVEARPVTRFTLRDVDPNPKKKTLVLQWDMKLSTSVLSPYTDSLAVLSVGVGMRYLPR